jgi:hypothetical protein
MNLQCRLLASAIVFCVLVGCSRKPMGGPRLETTPLSGKVLVDGEPATGLTVECHPESGSSAIKQPLYAMTDTEGKFSVGMYQAGDGLPEGTYSLAFRWEEFGRSDRDKLKTAYADPAKSKVKVTVVKGKANNLEPIELSTKNPK